MERRGPHAFGYLDIGAEMVEHKLETGLIDRLRCGTSSSNSAAAIKP